MAIWITLRMQVAWRPRVSCITLGDGSFEEYHKTRRRKPVSPRVANGYMPGIRMLLREGVLVLADLERSVPRALECIAKRYPNPGLKDRAPAGDQGVPQVRGEA